MKKLSLLLVLMLVLLAPLEVSAARVVNYNGIDTSGNTTYYAGKYGEAFLGVPQWYGCMSDPAYGVLISKNLHYNCKGGNMVRCWYYEKDPIIAELYNANFSGTLSACFTDGVAPPCINTFDTPLPIYDKVLQNSGYYGCSFYMSNKFPGSPSSLAGDVCIYDTGNNGTGVTWIDKYQPSSKLAFVALMVLFKGDDVLFLKEM